tara:strand:+ start:94 stop:519 length:426 start_codon:yes stop_codon:yes gene_type:complete
LITRKEKKESNNMHGAIITKTELDILNKLKAKGVSINTELIANECTVVEKKMRESHTDFCLDSEIKESVNKTRKDVKSLKGFKYEKTSLTTKQVENLGSNFSKVKKVQVSVDSYDINIKATYKFLDANGKEVKPSKEVKES